MGSLVHKGVEMYYKADRDPANVPVKMLPHIKKQIGWVRKAFGSTLWSEAQKEFLPARDLSVKMINNFMDYDQKANPTALKGEIHSVEMKIKQELPSGVIIAGKIDLILERSDGIWLIDHKTAARALDAMSVDVDDQATAYAWLFWKESGIVIKGFAFNVLYKLAPEPPPLIRKDTALSKSKSLGTTEVLYKQAVKAQGFKLKDYKEIILHYKREGWNPFFEIVDTLRSLPEIKQFEAFASHKSERLVRAVEDPDTYAYPSGSIYNCGWCPYKGACKIQSEGGDADIVLQNKFMPNTYSS